MTDRNINVYIQGVWTPLTKKQVGTDTQTKLLRVNGTIQVLGMICNGKLQAIYYSGPATVASITSITDGNVMSGARLGARLPARRTRQSQSSGKLQVVPIVGSVF